MTEPEATAAVSDADCALAPSALCAALGSGFVGTDPAAPGFDGDVPICATREYQAVTMACGVSMTAGSDSSHPAQSARSSGVINESVCS